MSGSDERSGASESFLNNPFVSLRGEALTKIVDVDQSGVAATFG